MHLLPALLELQKGDNESKDASFWYWLTRFPDQFVIGTFAGIVLLVILFILIILIKKVHVKVFGIEFNPTGLVTAPVVDQSFTGNGTERLNRATEFLRTILDPEVRERTSSLIEHLEQLPAIENPLFKDAINIDYSEFLLEVRNWTNSCVRIQGTYNDTFLIRIYRTAKQNIFSTCIADYAYTWQTDFGDRLLDAHKQNPHAEVTRVFIFPKIEDVTPAILDVMQNQYNDRIRVKVLIKADEDDFTFVDDGQIIGKTEEMKYGKRETKWMFNDISNISIFKNKKEHIENASLLLPAFRERLGL